MMTNAVRLAAGLAVSVTAAWAHGEDANETGTRASDEQVETIDLSEPTLFVVGYAHLDTQWRWTYIDTIRDFIPDTLYDNFELIDKYPSYVFNFGGSRRYEMMEEYYPEGFERMLGYVEAGRWFPCGSSVDENDANVPSAESQIRHALYGNRYFIEKLGVASDEFMLPDCFGFPAGLPSVLAHCGIKGFSTQKLTWNSVVPIPFKVGIWEGPDGRSVIAALDPGSYSGDVRENLANSDAWLQRIKNNGDESGLYVDYHYYGTGDVGGAPRESSVAMIEQSVQSGQADDAKIRIRSGTADAMFNAIPADAAARLPRYKGELELTQHSAGSVTSQSYMKRWNRKNELLADSAEKASVAAWWLGAGGYPAQRLQDAWELVLGSQMHDILPGTSVPLAYDLSWNDEIIAANQFGAILTDASRAVISAMDTRTDGTSVVVFNPLSWERTDLVEAEVPYTGAAPKGAVVTGPDSQRAVAQVIGATDGVATVAFVATVPSVGYASYGVELVDRAASVTSPLKISEDGRTLESDRYTVTFNERGDVSSIIDKQAREELLSAPATIGLFYENPSQWPAWNQDWEDRVKPATSFVGAEGPVSFKVVENGPARVAVEVTRSAEGSVFTQVVSLVAGSDRVEFDTVVDWNTRERSARAAFPLTATNANATYDVQVGTLERGNAHEKQYEYSFQQWFDLTDESGRYGASVMCDSKYGCDKPDDNTVRLTLLFTPGVRGGYPDQASQDLGRHHILYAVQGHEGDWRDARSWRRAAELNSPLVPFRTAAHGGELGKSLSMVSVSEPTVSVQALKKAEASDEVIIRVREHSGRDAAGVRIAAGAEIVSAREVDGQERPMGSVGVRDGEIVANIGAYELRAYAVTLADPPTTVEPPVSAAVALRFDTDVMSSNTNPSDGAMDGAARTYPAEQIPGALDLGGVGFALGSSADGEKNAITARGQTIRLPEGRFNRVYLLAASSEGDVETTVEVGGESVPVTVQSWDGYIGQWDTRQWPGDIRNPRYPWGSTDIIGLTPGYIKPGELGWYVSHHHKPVAGDENPDAFYEYSYIFKIGIDMPEGTESVTLPDDGRVKVFAISAAQEPAAATPAAPLFDTLEGHDITPPSIAAIGATTGGGDTFSDAVAVEVRPGMYFEAGAYAYTTDGSDPSAGSPRYTSPLTLSDTATVKVAAVDTDGKLGPVATRTVRVNDTTPPTVTSVLGVYESPELLIRFSEPVSSINAADLSVRPAIAVEGVALSEDRRTATVSLASAPAVDTRYALEVSGVTDRAPSANSMPTAAFDFAVRGPVFTLDEITDEHMGTSVRDIEGLPVEAGDSWTMNVWTRMERQPTNHTILVGFGNCNARAGGQARYLAKFANGVQFWSHNQDAPGREQYDLDRWQMITATYDGKTLTLYKDAEVIGRRDITLSDDANIVQIAPADPWDRRYRFEGDLANLTIWDAALTGAGVRSLLSSAPE